MAIVQSRCPHCSTVQPSAGNALQDCSQCAKSFYPAPVVAATGGALRRLQRRRGKQTIEAAAASARFWYIVRACGAVIFVMPLVCMFYLQWADQIESWPLSRLEGRLLSLVSGVLLVLGQVYLTRARAVLDHSEPAE
jgi:hypothetical protein